MTWDNVLQRDNRTGITKLTLNKLFKFDEPVCLTVKSQSKSCIVLPYIFATEFRLQMCTVIPSVQQPYLIHHWTGNSFSFLHLKQNYRPNYRSKHSYNPKSSTNLFVVIYYFIWFDYKPENMSFSGPRVSLKLTCFVLYEQSRAQRDSVYNCIKQRKY